MKWLTDLVDAGITVVAVVPLDEVGIVVEVIAREATEEVGAVIITPDADTRGFQEDPEIEEPVRLAAG